MGVFLLGILQWSQLIHAFTNNIPIRSSWKPAYHSEQQRNLFIHRVHSSVDDRNSEGDGNNSNDEEESNPRMRDRIRGWFRSSNSGDGEPERVKTSFDGLFSDMPGINDILGDGTSGNEQENDNTQTKKSRSREQDYAWFEEEKQKIIRSYEGILNDMLENLQSQRLEDPESVPDNAEAMIKSVLKQEMDTELKETQEKRAMERLDSYEKTERTRVDEEDVSGPVTDSRVQRLIDESEQEYERQMKAQLELDEFLKYEEEAIVKTQKPDTSTDITMPEPNANLDQWALERLEEMAQAKEDLGADEVLDILDDNLQDLKDRMEKESARGSLQPETMKEWQMYRAIATRLGASVDASGKVVKNVASDGQTITDEDIFLRLQSWKEYNEKEIGVREKGGLSRGPRLPFEWQELSDSGSRKISGTKASRMETRKQINRMSIEALESLMVSSDAARREKLQNEIDYLKRELEDKDYLDWEEPDDFEDVTGPVDLSDVFSSSSVETKKPDEKVEVKPVPPEAASPPVVEDSSGTPPPPNTPFFSDSEPEASTISPKPPSTPFFSDDESVDMKVADTDSKLGGMDEQNLENMFRKAGARTKEERDRIRAGYEEFKRVEEEKRKASGLEGSDYNFSEYEAKYNVSEVMLDGGDFDAQKILSSIGPRPKRVKKKTEDSESVQDPALKSSIDEKDVAASLYRSVSAAGGGRFKDDPSGEASFMDFLEQEKSMRETVDNIPDDQLSVDSSEGGFDDEEYADRAMSEIGPRPVTKKYNRVDEGYLSDNSGRLAGDDFSDDSEDEGENDISMQDDETAAFDEDIPEWVKQEREARDNPRRKTFLSANDIEDSFPDDEYEHNMRQLAEYERRRAGKEPRQMGIDISDVLGPRRRQDFETDDYKDYKYDDDYYRGTRVGWGQTTFDTRKRDLLEYTELDVPLLNALMEQRDAVSSSGVSRYMAKINKPFKEFGAIFRLEGVVADISGLQAKAWKKTAESLGTRAPILDEVKMAAVLRPEYAISDIFGWTTDVYEMQQIAAKYQDFFAENPRLGIEIIDTTNTTNVAFDGQSAAVFGQVDKGFLSDKLNLTAGLRLESFNIGNDDFSQVIPTFRLGGTYKSTPTDVFRASYGRGYRIPSLVERYIDAVLIEFPNQLIDNLALRVLPNLEIEPEIGWSSEIGYKKLFNVGDWKGYLDAAVFVMQYDNMAELTFGLHLDDSTATFSEIIQNIGFKYVNATKGRIGGYELTAHLDGKIGTIPLKIWGGYTYTYPGDLDSIETHNQNYWSNLFTAMGTPSAEMIPTIMLYRSLHTARFDIEFYFNKLTLGFVANYNGHIHNIDGIFEGEGQWAELIETLNGQPIIPGFEEYRAANTDGFWVFDARLAYHLNEQHHLHFVVTNVTNKEYALRPGRMNPLRMFNVKYQMEF